MMSDKKPSYEELESLVKEMEAILSAFESHEVDSVAGKGKVSILRSLDHVIRSDRLIRESEEKYRILYQNAGLGIGYWTLDGRLISLNNAACNNLGAAPENVIGKSITEIFGEENGSTYLERIYHASEASEPTVYEDSVCLAAGPKTFLSVYHAIRFPDGNVSGIQIISTDISERKRLETSLEKNLSLFQGLYDNMTSGSAIYEVVNDGSKGTDYIIKNFNKKSLEMEGRTIDEVVGKSLYELRPNIDEYGLVPVMKKVWETGEPAHYPTKKYQDDFFSNYYENYIFKIPSGEVVTIYDDVTDQKNAEFALTRSEERFKLAMEFANDGLFDWDLKTNEIYYSPMWKKLLGYEDDELPNDFSVWETLTDPEDVKRSWKMQQELINRQRDKFEIEFKMKHKDGHWVDILARANAIFDDNHQAVRIVGTHVDISQRKELEKKLLQSQKMESIGNLAGGIAHDFNNLLSSIIGYTELAIDEVSKGTTLEESLQEVLSAGNRAKELVKQILAFARQSDEKKGPVEPGLIAREVLKLIRSTIPATIEIRQEIDSDALILGNATQIHQVFLNLFTNAAHAMEATGGVLTLGLKDVFLDKKDLTAGMPPGKYLEMSVSDTGVGIAPDIIGSIFEPYFTTKGTGEGTGMGLAMVQGVVENHGGKITVESQPGKGTTFTICLPITDKPSGLDAHAPEIFPTGTEHILWVDDEPPIAKMGRQMLERLGYLVTTRTSSIEALELFKENPDDFDLVITDMTMPGLTGDRLAIELMNIRPDIPVILCTGYSKKISDQAAGKIGIKAFAYKPMAMADISKTVRRVLDEAHG